MLIRFSPLILIGNLSLTACGLESPAGLSFENQTVPDTSPTSKKGQTSTALEPTSELTPEPAPEPAPLPAPTPVSQISYSNQSLIALDASNIDNSLARVGVGEELKQTFQLRSPYQLQGDVSLEGLILSISFWPGQIHDIDINVYDHEARLIYTQKMTDWSQYQFVDPETALVTASVGGNCPTSSST